MSVLTIELAKLRIEIEDYVSGDPHVVIENDGTSIRIEPSAVRRLADVLTGASVMMTPEPDGTVK